MFWTSISTFIAKDALDILSIAALTDPQAAMWLSLIMIMLSRAYLWGSPPPKVTAFFWKSPNPGVVFLVAAMITFPSAASTASEVTVATPLMCMRKFSAVLSAVISPLSGPEMSMTRVPAFTRSPSLTSGLTFAPMSPKMASASSMPATTQSSSTVMYAEPSVSGTVSSVVRSPLPTSASR